jgi:hypothetical protein
MGSQLFGPLSKDSDIRVGYIDSKNGFVEGLSVCEANEVAQKDPGIVFIFKSGDNKLKYLNINEVNELSTKDVLNKKDRCAGVNQKVKVGPPKIEIVGGGGVGAVGNPIIGRDGSLLAVDIVRTGHGYVFQPLVKANDISDYGGGAILTAVLGELVVQGDQLVIVSDVSVSEGLTFTTTRTLKPKDGTIRGYRGKNETFIYQYYDRADDYEEYFLCDSTTIPYGRLWGPNGEDLGEWKPTSWIGGDDPILRDIQEFQRDVRATEGGFFNTRKFKPSRISTDNQNITGSYYKVTDKTFVEQAYPNGIPSNAVRWGSFMNKYAISPKPPSNVKGSDFAGTLFTFEWNLEFPTTGEYVFRGAKDNVSKLYVDNQFLSDLGGFQGAGQELKKYYEEGLHTVKLELLNKPIYETVTIDAYEQQIPGVDFIQKSNGIYMTVGGNQDVDVSLKLSYDDNPDTADIAISEITIPNSPGRQNLVLRRKRNKNGKLKEKGDVTGSATFARSEQGYGPIIFTGATKPPKLASKNKAYGDDTNKYGRINLFDKKGNDVNAYVSIAGTKNLQQSRPKKVEAAPDSEITNVEVFNTIDWINKANRKLWRTNIGGRGGFINKYGVCPFDTRKALADNPYAGQHLILWPHVEFPIDGNYDIEVEVDDNVRLLIGNAEGDGAIGIGNRLISRDEGGDEVIITKKGFKPNSDDGTGKSTYTRFFKKGRYRIRAELEQIPGGRFAFSEDGSAVNAPALPPPAAPAPPKNNARFIKKGGDVYLQVEGTGLVKIDLSLRTSDTRSGGYALSELTVGDVRLKRTGNKTYRNYHPDGRYQGRIGREQTGNAYEKKETISESGFFRAGRQYKVNRIGAAAGAPDPKIKNGRVDYRDSGNDSFDAELKITRVHEAQAGAPVPGPAIKGLNPMALAVRITASSTTITRISAKSWNQNPMGVALTIDAPEPTVPQEPPPVQDGRCPPNPIWTTRTAGAKEQWYPVTHSRPGNKRTWSDFTNRYAMSPVKPFAQQGTDSGGIVFKNSWTVEIPFEGFYGLKGTSDNSGRILIDGVEQVKGGVYFGNSSPVRLDGFRQNSPGTKKIFLTEGSHVIDVEVWNEETVTYNTIIKSIFNSQEWASPAITNDFVNVDFKVTTSAQFANSIKFGSGSGGEGFSFGKSYNGPQLNEQTRKRLKAGQVYDVTFASNRKDGGSNNKNYPIKVAAPGTKGRGPTAMDFDVTDKRIKYTDARYQMDKDASFIIESTSPGVSAKFSSDGSELIVKGNGTVTLKLEWSDDPSRNGMSVAELSVAGETFRQRGKSGQVTKTVKVSAGGGSSVPANLKLRSAGKRTVQMEDYKDNDWSDLVVTSSVGEFFDIKGNKAKFRVGSTLSPTTVRKKGGATYSGPELFRFNHRRWSKFMNKNNVSPLLPPIDDTNPGILGFFTYTWSNVNFTEDGQYRIRFQSDNAGSVFINGQLVSTSRGFRGDPSPEFVNLKAGRYEIRVEVENAPPNLVFNNNPTGLALKIDTPIKVPNASQSWKNNPIGISAVLISPPCPRRIDGRGIITDVIVENPGNGYVPPAPNEPGYPAILKLKEVLVKNPGINYNCGVDEVVIEPSNGAELDYECDAFGRIVKVNIVTPGGPFTTTPNITVRPGGDDPAAGGTGVNFEAVPLFEVERDPVEALTGGIPPDKLVQVTDLVGLKQTGYVDGRAYYGAVFYKDGIRYAGYFETAGQQIQVYDTLQESIDAEVTTEPSAILRQGTDINSNNPRLDIPGTPDELI